MLNHQLDKLLEAGLGVIPAQTGLSLGGVAPEVDNIRRSVKVRGNAYDYVAGVQLRVEG